METVAFDSASSSAAAEKLPSSATLAKIAQASKSGRRGIDPQRSKMETMGFDHLHLFADAQA
ncbi:hypothetical protein ACFSTI_09110 [Rhizorhabdus histidinilytica]